MIDFTAVADCAAARHRLHARRPKRNARTCDASGKHRFRDHREAIEALHRAGNSRKCASERGVASPRREVRSYLCKSCHGWHLTSQGQRR